MDFVSEEEPRLKKH